MLKTKEDWQVEVDALFKYLEEERDLSIQEAESLIKLLYIAIKAPDSIN